MYILSLHLSTSPTDHSMWDCGRVSDMVVCSMGARQGTVLSPFLFTSCTLDFKQNTDSCHLQKVSDDTAIVGCISEKTNWNTGGSSPTLLNGVKGTTANKKTPIRQRKRWLISAVRSALLFCRHYTSCIKFILSLLCLVASAWTEPLSGWIIYLPWHPP